MLRMSGHAAYVARQKSILNKLLPLRSLRDVLYRSGKEVHETCPWAEGTCTGPGKQRARFALHLSRLKLSPRSQLKHITESRMLGAKLLLLKGS